MSIRQLLFHGFSGSILGMLTEELADGLEVSLDGRPLAELSTHASGPNAFVVKAWLDPRDGPALRFRAAWGKLAQGRLWWQPHPEARWINADMHAIEPLELDSGMGLRVRFSVGMDRQHELQLRAPGLEF